MLDGDFDNYFFCCVLFENDSVNSNHTFFSC